MRTLGLVIRGRCRTASALLAGFAAAAVPLSWLRPGCGGPIALVSSTEALA